jgi:hypothetical protein
MEGIGRFLVLAGVLLIVVGGGLYLAARIGLPLGRLPGDIRIEGQGGAFYFPVTTSVLVSIVLTILMNLIIRFFHK